MIIKTMEELAKAVDDGKKIELKCRMRWISIYIDILTWAELLEFIDEGKIRIKPTKAPDCGSGTVWFGSTSNDQ